MNHQEREHIGRLIQRFGLRAPTDDLLVLIAETGGLLEACSRLVRETGAGDRAVTDWLRQQCEAARVLPTEFLAEIEAILTVFRPGTEHGDLYAELELEPGASLEAIKRSYRRLCRRYHPDAVGGNRDDAAFMRITNAYHRLLHGEAQAKPPPAARRENSHWRQSAVVPGPNDLRRTQKRKNVVMVALLSLTLIFVSLLAARTYNSHVMMSGLKNKSLAFVPPTAEEQTPAATTIAAIQSTPPSDEHTSEVGHTPRIDNTLPATSTAITEAQPAPADPTPSTVIPSPPLPDEHGANVGCAARTDCTERTAATASEPPAHAVLVSLTPATRKYPVSADHTKIAFTSPVTVTSTNEPAAKPTIASTQPPADEPAANVGCAARTNCTPSSTSTAAHPATTAPGTKIASTSPVTSTSTNKPAAHPTIASTQPPADEPAVNVGCAARTNCTPSSTSTAAQPTTAASAPSEQQTRQRIDAFLRAYTTAYEQKNLPAFSGFFVPGATENGKTLNDVLPSYTDLFDSAKTLRFTVSPGQWERVQGQLHLRGRFTIAMTFKDGASRTGAGDIDFRLTDTTPPQVQTLRYAFDQ